MTEIKRDRRVSTLDPQYVKRTTDDQLLSPLTSLTPRPIPATSGAGDISPHFGGARNPGTSSVFETGGETTNLGDTSRRREQAASRDRKDVAEDVKKRRDDERD